MPHGGLALANSLATALEMVGLFLLMRRRLKGLQGGWVLEGLGAAALGSGVMSAVLGLWMWLVGDGKPVWVLAGGVALGAAVYGGMLVLLGVAEVRQVLAGLRRRLKI